MCKLTFLNYSRALNVECGPLWSTLWLAMCGGSSNVLLQCSSYISSLLSRSLICIKLRWDFLTSYRKGNKCCIIIATSATASMRREGGRCSSSPALQLWLPCGRSVLRLDSDPVRCCCRCCVLAWRGKEASPEFSSSLKSLEISPLQRRVPVSESRDELCPPWTQNSEYLWPKALFVKLCESADLPAGRRWEFNGPIPRTHLLLPLCRHDWWFPPSVTTSSSSSWLVTQGWANPACCSGRKHRVFVT